MVPYVLTARNDFVFFVDREMRPEGGGGVVRSGVCNFSQLVTILTVFLQYHSVAFVEEKGTKSEKFLFPF
jgi:hypothetical protein